ncbi:MAG: hypothetical protein HQL40_19035 [Alphaproteobacteria bacterium]|nr:hypothetical protein [Alphaproteobacteria bacterium]
MDPYEPAAPPAGGRRPARGRIGGGTVGLLIVALALLGGIAAWPWAQPRLARFLQDARPASPVMAVDTELRLQDLEAGLPSLSLRQDMTEQGLAQMEAKLARLAATAVAPPPPRPEGDERARLAEMTQEIAALRDEMGALRRIAVDQGGAMRLSSAIEKTESAVNRLAERRDASPLLLVAVGQLREALDRGGSFEAELRAVRAIAQGEVRERLAMLEPAAPRGIATRAALAESFREAAAATRRLAVHSFGQPWLGDALRSVSAWISIRRVDGGDATLAAGLARAGRLIAAGDLGSAVEALRRQEGVAGSPLTPWLEAAGARIEADALVSQAAAAALALSASRG